MSDLGTPGRAHVHLNTPKLRPASEHRTRDDNATFTIRSALVGITIGLMVCCANLYLGLQAGLVNSMTIPSALMGFAFFKLISGYLETSFTPGENVLVQTISSSLGNMPVTSGYNGVIPALEYLVDSNEGGPLRFSKWQLLAWSFGTSLLGVVFAAALRKQFILRKPLRFPTGTASAVLIGTLHDRGDIIDTIKKDRASALEVHTNAAKSPNFVRQTPVPSPQAEVYVSQTSRQEHVYHEEDPSGRSNSMLNFLWQHRAPVLAFVASALFTLLSFFIPQLEAIPLFGVPASRDWAWSIDPGPVYIGFGMIMDPSTTAWVMIGAILGWGVLSPLVKSRGWAPGPVTDWQHGSQGWIVWVALGAILGDSAVGIAWLILQPLISTMRAGLSFDKKLLPGSIPNSSHPDVVRPEGSSRVPSEENEGDSATEMTPLLKEEENSLPAKSPYTVLRQDTPGTVLSNRTVAWYLILAFLLCLCTTIYLFGDLLSVWQIVLAVILIGPLGIGSIRAMGETDNSLAGALSKTSQFLFALIIPSSNSKAIITSLIVGAIAEAGVFQSSDVMEHFKTGFLTGASPRAVFYGQVIGSVVGAVFSTFVYRLYTSVYTIPSKRMPAPSAQLWYATAKLAYGRGLPQQVWGFAVTAFALAAILAAVKIGAAKQPWVYSLPTGIAIGVGIYILPSYTIPLAIGGLIHYYSKVRMQVGELSIIMVASAFVLGEGVFKLVNIVMGALEVPHL